MTVMTASCAAAPAAPGHTPSGTRSLPAAPSPSCRPGQLALRHGPRLSPATEERGDVYLLVNRGRMSCTLAGFPGIALYGPAGNRLLLHTDCDHHAPAVARPGGRAGVVRPTRGVAAELLPVCRQRGHPATVLGCFAFGHGPGLASPRGGRRGRHAARPAPCDSHWQPFLATRPSPAPLRDGDLPKRRTITARCRGGSWRSVASSDNRRSAGSASSCGRSGGSAQQISRCQRTRRRTDKKRRIRTAGVHRHGDAGVLRPRRHPGW